MAKGKKNGKRGKTRGGGALNAMPANPPAFRAITTLRKKFRFYASVAWASGTITEAHLLSMPGTMCTVVNSTVVATQVSVKIHGVKIWGVAPSAGNSSTVSLRWFGTQAAAANTHQVMQLTSDTSTNPAHAPRISARPPAGSNASFWLSADNSGSDRFMTINCPQNSVVEFDLEFNHGMPPAVGSFTSSVSAGTLGVMYWLSFGSADGTGFLTPTDLATTS